MPRKTRTHRRGMIYHVMGRGNGGENIFIHRDNYLHFYSLMEKIMEYYDCRLHIFCLMTNHVHLVIEIDLIPLRKVIQSLFSQYAAYFNRYTQKKGHVFQGRFRSETVYSDQYLRNLCVYIHRNPLRAKLVSELSDYEWSSHQVYSSKQEIAWLSQDYVLEILKNELGDMNNIYEYFIENTIVKPELIQLKNELDENASQSVLQKLIAKKNQDPYLNIDIESIVEIVCKTFAIKREDLIDEGKPNKLVLARSMAAYFAHYRANFELKEIAYLLNRDRTVINRGLRKLVKKNESDHKVQRLISLIEHKLAAISLGRCDS